MRRAGVRRSGVRRSGVRVSALASATLVLLLSASAAVSQGFQGEPEPSLGSQIATYRLTAPVFVQFEAASRAIAAVTHAEPRFTTAPLFTREVALLGDIQAVALGLEARLRNDPSLAPALVAAKLSPRDYAKFALVLIAARMAHGFVNAGVLRGVPPGVTADNVAFVAAHQAEVETLLEALGVNGMPADAR